MSDGCTFWDAVNGIGSVLTAFAAFGIFKRFSDWMNPAVVDIDYQKRPKNIESEEYDRKKIMFDLIVASNSNIIKPVIIQFKTINYLGKTELFERDITIGSLVKKQKERRRLLDIHYADNEVTNYWFGKYNKKDQILQGIEKDVEEFSINMQVIGENIKPESYEIHIHNPKNHELVDLNIEKTVL